MYIPKHFQEKDRDKIFSFVKENAFGQLISSVEGRLFSTHIPFLLGKNNQSIFCHVAKNNPQWEDIEDQEVLVTFQGPHDYVSPSWYVSSGVPTWNYQSVHIYGKPNIINNEENLATLVNELTKIYESSFEKPWSPKYKNNMLRAIVGVEIEITDIQCKYKLSQNRSLDDRLRVSEEHENRGSLKLADATRSET